MTNSGLITLLSLAVLFSLALTSCLAKDALQQPASSSSLASKLLPQTTKARTSRSLGDMFEKVRSKIFGNRKQQTSASNSQVQPAASVNAAQRQPWADLNSINQQFNPYSPLANSYQFSGSQYLNQQYNPMSGFAQSAGGAYPGLSGSQSQAGASSLISGIDGQQAQPGSQSQSSLSSAANSNAASNGGLLSSASHLIAQYLSPSSASSSSNAQVGQSSSQGQSNGQQQQNLLSPQQQQQQSQYNEFASILDSMVAQTGANNQRQPSLNQFLGNAPVNGQQGLQSQNVGSQGFSGSAGNIPSVGDNEMSGSSNIQSYMPASSQQASQKSSMVGLAEQLAPGANFNKLVSFPFSLTSNDDPSKDGRFKLHIPFLNQHVKRSDQPQPQSQQAASSPVSQPQRQYLNPYYSQQQQQYMASLANQAQQLVAQSSQVVPTIVSPQSSVSQLQSSSAGAQQNSPAAAVNPASQSSGISSSSSSVPQSSASSSSSSSSVSNLSSPNNPSSASQSAPSQTNSRPSWSVADLQSSPSSSKLIPVQSAASSSADSAAIVSQS